MELQILHQGAPQEPQEPALPREEDLPGEELEERTSHGKNIQWVRVPPTTRGAGGAEAVPFKASVHLFSLTPIRNVLVFVHIVL